MSEAHTPPRGIKLIIALGNCIPRLTGEFLFCQKFKFPPSLRKIKQPAVCGLFYC